MLIPVKPATQSGESGHSVGAKRRWGFHDDSGGRFHRNKQGQVQPDSGKSRRSLLARLLRVGRELRNARDD